MVGILVGHCAGYSLHRNLVLRWYDLSWSKIEGKAHMPGAWKIVINRNRLTEGDLSELV